MDKALLQRIAESGLPVHNRSGLPVFYSDGEDDLLTWPAFDEARCKAMVISVPRSGTHFTSKLLEGLGWIFGGLHLSPSLEHDLVQDRRCLRLDAQGQTFWPEYRLAVGDALRLVAPGQFLQGHVPFSQATRDALADFRVLLVERNLRDVAVSSMRFIASLHARGMQFSAERNVTWCAWPDGPAKMLAYLRAFGDGVGVYVDQIAPWRACGNVHVLDFDALNGTDGAAARASMLALGAFLGTPLDDAAARDVLGLARGSDTPTWTGQLSAWRALWNDEVETVFEQVVLARPSALARDDEPESVPASAIAAVAAAPTQLSWLRGGQLAHGEPSMAEVCLDRLFDVARPARVLDLRQDAYVSDGASVELTAGGVRLVSRDETTAHKHMTIPLGTLSIGVHTLEVIHYPARGASWLMLQMGSANGFFNCYVDARARRVGQMASSGDGLTLCARVDAEPDGAVKISLSGLIGTGANPHLRVYLCDDNGELHFSGPLALELGRIALLFGAEVFGAACWPSSVGEARLA